ncbi:hypothetical protein TSUD_251070 [Trifolium subterraneum]|uniref:Phytocyanin domain-containing protein n=1 Tax=Trifolium subterraneum TaxID=3900 RepID=A0A2Z6LR39_TRISU|nr:hypothetical protein TSUD_251070 [Trifolium subterraneum]
MLLMMMMSAMMCHMVKSKEHFVGGSEFGWVPLPANNLTNWSLNEHFHLNDWLYFGYDRRYFNVLEVNKTSYENCIDAGFLKNVSGGAGRDVFQLTKEKTYYFLSGGGYCRRGLKVAIDVNDYVAPAPAPTPHKSGASALDAYNIYHSLVVLILILMCSNFLG